MTVLYDESNLYHVFVQKCLEKFRYLETYGFELTSIEEDKYMVEITYKNQTAGIKVSLDVKENQIFVYLIRLINGEIPDYLDAPSRWFYLDNLVKLKAPSITLPRKEFGDWLTPDDIEEILAAYTSALKEYGEDVLRGDFSAFAELARQIDRPNSSNDIDEVRLIRSSEELSVQKKRLLAQLVEYYDTYFSELRSQLRRPVLFSEAVPEFLKGYKRVISIGGRNGVVVAHFPIELEITFSETDGGSPLIQFPSLLNAREDSYEFIQFPGSPVSDLVTFISGGEDVDIDISPEETFWGVKGFKSPQQKVDLTTGQLTWQAPWTRLVAADLYHLRYWENTERAEREAEEDIEPYVRGLESYSGETAPDDIEERRQRLLRRYAGIIKHEEKERAYFRSMPSEKFQSFAADELDEEIRRAEEEVHKLRTRTSYLDDSPHKDQDGEDRAPEDTEEVRVEPSDQDLVVEAFEGPRLNSVEFGRNFDMVTERDVENERPKLRATKYAA